MLGWQLGLLPPGCNPLLVFLNSNCVFVGTLKMPFSVISIGYLSSFVISRSTQKMILPGSCDSLSRHNIVSSSTADTTASECSVKRRRKCYSSFLCALREWGLLVHETSGDLLWVMAFWEWRTLWGCGRKIKKSFLPVLKWLFECPLMTDISAFNRWTVRLDFCMWTFVTDKCALLLVGIPTVIESAQAL